MTFRRLAAPLLAICLSADPGLAVGSVQPPHIAVPAIPFPAFQTEALNVLLGVFFRSAGQLNKPATERLSQESRDRIPALLAQPVVAAEGVLQCFGVDAKTQLGLTLASYSNMPEREWPKPLRELYKYRRWFHFVSGEVSWRSGHSQHEDAISSYVAQLLGRHGVRGRIASNQRFIFHRQNDGSYRGPENLKSNGAALVLGLQNVLNLVVKSHHPKLPLLPKTIVVQGMRSLEIRYVDEQQTHSINPPALIVAPNGGAAYIAITNLADLSDYEKLESFQMHITNAQFSGPINKILQELEIWIHEVTHGTAPAGIREFELQTIMHSFVDVVHAAVLRAGYLAGAAFPFVYVDAVFHALNPKVDRLELIVLEEYLNERFLDSSAGVATITPAALRDWVNDFIDQRHWRKKEISELAALLEMLGVDPRRSKPLAEAIYSNQFLQLKSKSLHHHAGPHSLRAAA